MNDNDVPDEQGRLVSGLLSDDPIDQMVDVLSRVSSDVNELKRAIEAKAPGTESVEKMEAALADLRNEVKRTNPHAVTQAAQNGARAIVPELQKATNLLQAALPYVQQAEDRRWWLWGIVTLAVVLGHLAAFTGGMVYIRSGLALDSEFGCRYLGGHWSVQKEGTVCAYWRLARTGAP